MMMEMIYISGSLKLSGCSRQVIDSKTANR